MDDQEGQAWTGPATPTGVNIDEMPVDSFDWIRWRACEIFEVIGVRCRTRSILSETDAFRTHAIGFIPGHKLACRPKRGTVAVMFLLNDEFQWCHLTDHEFEEIFR